jgi:hypothetical protein
MAWTTVKCSLGERHTKGRCRGEHRYLIRWREPQPPHRTISRQFHRFEDARSFKLDIERQIDRREYPAEADRAVPLQDYVAGILASSTELRSSSLDVYRATLRHHIQGTGLGQSPIGRISSTLLREYWAGLAIGNGPKAEQS